MWVIFVHVAFFYTPDRRFIWLSDEVIYVHIASEKCRFATVTSIALLSFLKYCQKIQSSTCKKHL